MKRIHSLEGLRGLMALWVFFAHAVSLCGIEVKRGSAGFVFLNGVHAVYVFIILSGFVIAMMLDKTRETYLPFIIRRAFRLFPVYWLALLLSVLTIGIALQVVSYLPLPKNIERVEIFNESMSHAVLHLVAHIPLLHGLIPDAVLPSGAYAFMGQAWSLTLEWQFYLIAPAMVALVYGRLRVGVLVVVATMLAAYLLSRMSQESFVLNYLQFFFAGILSYRCMNEFGKSTLSISQASSYLFLICVCVAASDFRRYSFAVIIWLVVLLSELSSNSFLAVVNRILSSAPCQYLGRISYSLYCLHMVFLYGVSYLLIFVFSVPVGPIYAVTLLLSALSLCLVFCHYSYRFVEVPMMDLGKSFVKKLWIKNS